MDNWAHKATYYKKRQRAFHAGDAQLWRQYRRMVQIEIKPGKITSILKKSITCGKTMSVNGILLVC